MHTVHRHTHAYCASSACCIHRHAQDASTGGQQLCTQVHSHTHQTIMHACWLSHRAERVAALLPLPLPPIYTHTPTCIHTHHNCLTVRSAPLCLAVRHVAAGALRRCGNPARAVRARNRRARRLLPPWVHGPWHRPPSLAPRAPRRLRQSWKTCCRRCPKYFCRAVASRTSGWAIRLQPALSLVIRFSRLRRRRVYVRDDAVSVPPSTPVDSRVDALGQGKQVRFATIS